MKLIDKLHSKPYRDAYIRAHTRRFLAQQMRAFRGDWSQGEMATFLGKAQSIISRLEDPNYGTWNITTLFDVAEKLDKALIVRFVDPQTFIESALNVDDDAQNPNSFFSRPRGRPPGKGLAKMKLKRAIAATTAFEKTAAKAIVDQEFDINRDAVRHYNKHVDRNRLAKRLRFFAEDERLISEACRQILLDAANEIEEPEPEAAK